MRAHQLPATAAVSHPAASGAVSGAAVLPSTRPDGGSRWTEARHDDWPADAAAIASPGGGEAAAIGEAPHAAQGRRPAVHLGCRVPGCWQPLGLRHPSVQKGKVMAAYSRSKGVCMAHLRLDVVYLDGDKQRYCQARKWAPAGLGPRPAALL